MQAAAGRLVFLARLYYNAKRSRICFLAETEPDEQESEGVLNRISARKEGKIMAKIDIISGFLGAGKTTLIKKLIQDVFAGQKVVLIENEFGEIGIDGGFLKEAGSNITEMN